MVPLEETPVWQEILMVIEDGPKPVFKEYTAEFHYDDVSIPFKKVSSLDLLRNYEANMIDCYILDGMISLGVYMKSFYPNRNKLEITVYKKPLLEMEDELTEEPIEQERYLAFPVMFGLPSFEGSEHDRHDEFALDNVELLNIKFQLIPKDDNQLRVLQFGGIFRDCLPMDAVKAVLATESAKVLKDGLPAVVGIDVVPEDNLEKRDHVIFPQSINVLASPSYAQLHCGGLYKTGIGSYYQNQYIWVYPLFNTERYEDDVRDKLVIYNLPANRTAHVERTYRVEGDIVYIVATGAMNIADDGDIEFSDKGSGFRHTSASSILDGAGAVETKGNKTVIKRKKMGTEALTNKKESGGNFAKFTDIRIGDNLYLHYSNQAAKNGAIVSIEWHNSLPELLIPGMMVRLHYMDKDELLQTDGVLLCVQNLINLKNNTINSSRYDNNSMLSIFVRKTKK
jgi:hypothetical protein